jgi:hypothetical protein
VQTASTTPTVTANRCTITVNNTFASGDSDTSAAYCAAVQWSGTGSYTGTVNAYNCRMSSTVAVSPAVTARIFVAHNSSTSGASACNINAYNCHSVIPSGSSGAHVYANGQGSGRTATVAIYACTCGVVVGQHKGLVVDSDHIAVDCGCGAIDCEVASDHSICVDQQIACGDIATYA